MNKLLIKLSELNLHYSSAAYQDRSFKKFIFQAVSGKKTNLEDIHALKDLHLEIKQGERVGLIGHNGAGKSTLLKTIANLYPISSGELTVTGRVRALFELVLGFEPDATGRENIYYRSLLLGKKPWEVKHIIDEIIEFAGLGKFIEYPIKTYSAGMLVKLAFSISTAIEGEILLLDEVIGAGDAAFMQRAKQRINNLINSAEILILASHDFGAIRSFCNRAIVLDQGRIVFDGEIEEGIRYYQKSLHRHAEEVA